MQLEESKNKESDLMRVYSISDERVIDLYTKLVMKNLQLFTELTEENNKFKLELEESSALKDSRMIINEYDDKF